MKCLIYALALQALMMVALAPAQTAQTAEVSPEQQAEAAALLAELAADQQVAEAEDEAASMAIQKARSQLQAAEIALLEAKAWLERDFPVEAGQAFLEAGQALAAIDETFHQALQPRLQQAQQARLSIARALLADDYLQPEPEPKPKAEIETETETGAATPAVNDETDVETDSPAPGTVPAAGEAPAADEAPAAGEAPPSPPADADR